MKKVQFVQDINSHVNEVQLSHPNFMYKLIALQLLKKHLAEPNKSSLLLYLKKIKQKSLEFPLVKSSTIPINFVQIYDKPTLLLLLQSYLKGLKNEKAQKLQQQLGSKPQIQFVMNLFVRSIIKGALFNVPQILLGNQIEILTDYNRIFIHNIFRVSAILLKSKINIEYQRCGKVRVKSYQPMDIASDEYNFVVREGKYYYVNKIYEYESETTRSSRPQFNNLASWKTSPLTSPTKRISDVKTCRKQQNLRICLKCKRQRKQNQKFCICRKIKK